MKLKLGVIGSGFVGGAVINGFNTPNVDMWVVDPKKSTTTLQQHCGATRVKHNSRNNLYPHVSFPAA